MIITKEQKDLLTKYISIRPEDDVDDVLEKLDDKITEIGFTDDFERLNPVGHDLQLLYDALYSQN